MEYWGLGHYCLIDRNKRRHQSHSKSTLSDYSVTSDCAVKGVDDFTFPFSKQKIGDGAIL